MGRPSVVAAWAPPGRTQAGPGARSACSAAEGQVNIADEAVRAPVRTGWLWSAERLLRSGGQGQHRGRGRPRSGARRLALERGAPAPQRRGPTTRGRGRPRSGAHRLALERGAPAPQQRGPTTRGRGRPRSGACRLALERGAPAPQGRADNPRTRPSALRCTQAGLGARSARSAAAGKVSIADVAVRAPGGYSCSMRSRIERRRSSSRCCQYSE